jgi:hypothetical protein
MNRNSLSSLVALALVAGCSGRMLVESDLGTAAAGAPGDSVPATGGTAGAPVDPVAPTGGTAGAPVDPVAPTGGTAGAPVDPVPPTGGTAGAPVDPVPLTGGTGATGGEAGSLPVAYPWEPTLPVDTECTCPSRSEICNAADQCVQRCDEEDRCALWLTERAVRDMYVDGSVLYYLTASSQDALGNPRQDGALWRVTYPDGVPKRTAGDLGDPTRIIGRVARATYIVASDGALEVSDDGEVRELGVGGSAYGGCALASEALFCGSDTGLVRLALDPGATPETVPGAESGCTDGIAADALAWCMRGDRVLMAIDTDDLSSATFSVPTPGPYAVLAARGSNVFVRTNENVTSVDGTDGQALVIYRFSDGVDGYVAVPSEGRLLDGWFYATTYSVSSSAIYAYLQRVPTAVGRLPEDVLPPELVRAATYECSASTGCGSEQLPIFAAGDAGIFWAQHTLTQDHRGLNSAQYIFHASLAPEPCDTELPCERTGELCSDAGLCEPR